MKRQRRQKSTSLRKILIFGLVFFLILGLGRRFRSWMRGFWDGKSQLSLAIETQSKRILVLALTPEKRMATVLIIPSNLSIETPWFGAYRAGKLSLLAKQEGKDNIFPRSLEYFLGIPIDKGLIGSDIALGQINEAGVKRTLRRFFSPWRSIDNFRIWSWLKRRDLVWRVIDLGSISQEEKLPDGSIILTIDSGKVSEVTFGLFTDPLVKNENIAISVFNSGGASGLAQKIATMVTSFGGRVVEVADSKREVDDCLILFSREDLVQSTTLRRLESVLGCSKKQGRGEGLGDIQIFIKNVKI